MTRKIFLAIIFLFAFSFSARADHSNLTYIDGNYSIVGDNYITLIGSNGDGIINALSMLPSGGTLTLLGTFNVKRTITINKSVKIQGGRITSTLNGNKTCRIFEVKAQDVEFENLSITGGNISSSMGGGIYLNSGSLTITNCQINDCTADIGGGIYANKDTTLNVSECEISGNTSNLFGGGGIALISATAQISKSKIKNNTEKISWGGGIFSFNSNFTLNNCEISGNFAKCYGGGLYISHNTGGKTNITNCKIFENSCVYRGGGLHLLNDSGEIKISKCEISSNKTTSSSSWGGGGLLIYNGSAEISGSSVKNNISAWDGGGIFIRNEATLNVNNCEISGNTAANNDNDIHNEGTLNTASLSDLETSNENSSGGCENFSLGLAGLAIIFLLKRRFF